MAQRLIWIAIGYGLALAGGCAAVMLNEWTMPQEISQSTGGMVAFGDMVLFVLVAGAIAVVPTWFLLRLAFAIAPRAALGLLLLLAIAGPASWLLTMNLGEASSAARLPEGSEWLGLLVAHLAIPRIVAGPVLLFIEAASFRLVRQRAAHLLLAAMMLMDAIPIGLFIRHLVRATA